MVEVLGSPLSGPHQRVMRVNTRVRSFQRLYGIRSQKRWKIETHARLDSMLHLNSVNLPGGELRRRSDEDEREMREYLAEGDLISAEVWILALEDLNFAQESCFAYIH